jgi:putative transposase
VRFIDEKRKEFGVEPICKTLQFAPSTYHATKKRPPSATDLRHEDLKPELLKLWKKNRRVYGARKLHKAARRAGIDVGRDQTATIMRKAGISGVRRGKKRRTTWPDETSERPADLVDRKFTAPSPNRLWVADITYVPTWSGFAYVSFVTDAFSRSIVGWKVSSSLSAELALDALEMAIWRRKGDLSKLIHLSESGLSTALGESRESPGEYPTLCRTRPRSPAPLLSATSG